MNHVLLTQDIIDQGYLQKSDPRAKHILSILKIKPQETFRAGVLHHSRGTATLLSCDAHGIHLSYKAELSVDKPLPITMFLGATRPPVMQRILRDVTAFGVERIVISHTSNSEKSYLQSHIWKDENYLIPIYEGLSLAKSVSPPEIAIFFSLKEALEQVHTPQRFLADPSASVPLSPCRGPQTSLTLAIGPERGFTQMECAMMREHHFESGSLGERIIRTETACFVALGIVARSAGLI